MRQRIRKRLATRQQYPQPTIDEESWQEPGPTDDPEILDAMQPIFPDIPVGGQLRLFYSKWCKITSDPAVLDIVHGMHIELIDRPVQHHLPKPLKLSDVKIAAADDQIATVLEKRAIVQSVREPGDFISNVFLTPK